MATSTTLTIDLRFEMEEALNEAIDARRQAPHWTGAVGYLTELNRTPTGTVIKEGDELWDVIEFYGLLETED